MPMFMNVELRAKARTLVAKGLPEFEIAEGLGLLGRCSDTISRKPKFSPKC